MIIFKIEEPLIFIENIFHFSDHLSLEVDKNAFAESFLIQPYLFIRIRPGKKNIVLKKLSEANIAYQLCNESCVALPNSTKVDSVLQINKEAVIQDKSSQETGKFIGLNVSHHSNSVFTKDNPASRHFELRFSG